MIRVLIADDHPIVRTGLRSLVDADPALELVGEAENGVDAVAQYRAKLPDVLVLDLQMPELDGLSAVEEIREFRPDACCLLLTMHEEPALARRALEAGCLGYVAKKAVAGELVSAIKAVADGRLYVNADRDGLSEPPESADQPQGALERLSGRERQVAVMLARGLTAREIGQEIHLSHKTVGTYRGRIYDKLGVHSRGEITQMVLEAGLLQRGAA